MMMFGTVLAAALAILAAASWRMLRARHTAIGNWLGTIALGVWCAGVAIAWYAQPQAPGARSELVRNLDSLAWPAREPSPLVTPAPAPRAAQVQAAPVEALIGGLEARLAEQPNDANGWALLAQSYAYTANEEAVERAVQRAVELGFDEAALRERVRSAEQRAHPVDWVQQAIGANRR